MANDQLMDWDEAADALIHGYVVGRAVWAAESVVVYLNGTGHFPPEANGMDIYQEDWIIRGRVH